MSSTGIPGTLRSPSWPRSRSGSPTSPTPAGGWASCAIEPVFVPETVAGDDADAVRRAAHSLKSSAGNVGAFTVLEAADRLEAAAEDGAAAETLRSLLDVLTAAYEVASPELQLL